jgi:hypothetical protein
VDPSKIDVVYLAKKTDSEGIQLLLAVFDRQKYTA